MLVTELNQEQLNELKWSYFYSDDYDPHITDATGLPVLFADDIPNAVIYEKFNCFSFVPDDFSCNCSLNNDIDNYIQYDSKTDIEQCLNCNKPECTNCLKLKNGV